MKTLKKYGFFLLPLLFIVNGFVAYAQVAKGEAELQKMMQDLKVVGLSVAVVKNGEIIYSNAFGQKNIEKNTKLTSSDIFRIASISKSFCATAVMQLVEAKKLKLEDNVSDLVGFKVVNPNFPDKVITLKMLLSHTSSLNDSDGYFNFDMIDPAKNEGRTKCYSKYEPGSEYKYCNLNFTLIGAIVERASGMRFDNYIKKNIIDPLGLNAGYNVDSLDSNKFATLYTYDKKTETFNESKTAYRPNRNVWNNYQLGYSAYSFSPTGGMKISAIDLAKYMTMHMNYGVYKGKRIISETSAKLMQKGVVKVGDEEEYAFAIRRVKSNDIADGNLLVGHTGSASGLYSTMFFNPEKKFGMVLISTGSLPDNHEGAVRFRKVLSEGMNILYRNFIK
ncbi:serine hydrolase [Pedobacter sp. UBA4863]|uniref:serine hydrolase domain-containing protein n=1 Tax=Pedobacter sp. UBA4863 TaxID=1947060 RepID=UPI0025F34808|nr:serine hydrolase domain-containing protein [Pedobacter sp. UBA4863]